MCGVSQLESKPRTWVRKEEQLYRHWEAWVKCHGCASLWSLNGWRGREGHGQAEAETSANPKNNGTGVTKFKARSGYTGIFHLLRDSCSFQFSILSPTSLIFFLSWDTCSQFQIYLVGWGLSKGHWFHQLEIHSRPFSIDWSIRKNGPGLKKQGVECCSRCRQDRPAAFKRGQMWACGLRRVGSMWYEGMDNFKVIHPQGSTSLRTLT